MHVIWYTAMSMDGRIAGPSDDLSFLGSVDSPTGGTQEWASFLDGLDAVIVGARTVRWLEDQGHGGLPYSGKATWLMSHDSDLAVRIARDGTPLERREGDVGQTLEEIEASGARRAWLCGGGDLAGQILAEDRIDEVILTIAPVGLGAGPALFESDSIPMRRFKLEECRIYAGDSVRLRYVRRR